MATSTERFGFTKPAGSDPASVVPLNSNIDLIELYLGRTQDSIAPLYDDTETYSVGDLRTYESRLYKCNTDISTPETFDSTKWAQTSIEQIIDGVKGDVSQLNSSLTELDGLNVVKRITTPASVVSFSDGSNLPIYKLLSSIDPIQDLHGYDAPWAGGAGKNKANIADMNIQSQTPMGKLTLPSGTYVASATVKNNTSIGGTIKINTSSETLAVGEIPSASGTSRVSTASFTLSESTEIVVVVSGALSGYNYDVSQVQIEVGTTATSFKPYSNICPISGFTEANVVVSPLNISQLYNGQIYGNGTWISNSTRITNVVNAQDNSYFLKKGTYTLDFDILNQDVRNVNACTLLTKDENYNIIDNFAGSWKSLPFTFTLTQDAYVYFTVRRDNTNINPSDFRAKILGQTYNIQFKDGSNPLTVYGGTLDVVSGVLTVKRVGVDMATLNWTNSSSNHRSYCYDIKNLIKIPSSQSAKSGCIAEKYFEIPSIGSLIDGEFAVAQNGDLIFYYDGVNPPSGKLVYPLATPLTIQLTPTQVKSLLGSNNVWADTGDILEVDYTAILNFS